MGKYLGIIDLGSNTARLSIYYQNANDLFVYEIDNYKNVLRLSSYIDDYGYISVEGIDKTIEVIEQFNNICKTRNVAQIIAVATAATREAQNGKKLIKQLQKKTGISFCILSGEEEANYGYLAIINSIDIENAVSIDIGGGSTEITLIENKKNIQSVSLPVGAVSLTKKFISKEILSDNEIKKLDDYLIKLLSEHSWIRNKRYPIVAIGGTARNMAKVHQNQNNYPLTTVHNYFMSNNEVNDIFNHIRKLKFSDRKKIKGLSKDRIDIIPAGIYVFKVLMDYVNSNQLIISNKGLRDGIIYENLLKKFKINYFNDVTIFSIEQLMNRYLVNKIHAKHVAKLANIIVNELQKHEVISITEKERKILTAASLLHDIGRSISIYSSTNHTFYLLKNNLISGFTHRESLLVAYIASYKSRKVLKEKFDEFKVILNNEDLELIERLGTILLLARSLDRTMSQMITNVKFYKQNDIIKLSCTGPNNLIEYTTANNILGKFKKCFKYDFILET